MRIRYDDNLKVAGIGMVPWTRLGPERWLPKYKIASLYGWDVALENAPQVKALHDSDPDVQLARVNSQHLIENANFQEMLRTNFSGYDMMTYKPVLPPKALAGIRFISGNQALARQLENKAAFRRLMQYENISFPEYKLYDRHALNSDDAAMLLAGRDSVIVQDEHLSGGKGTFVVRDERSLAYALESIERMNGGAQVVVSERVVGAHERSVQCCVTRYGVFVGPLQKQIIGDSLLANLHVPDGDKFCGAEITASDTFAAAYTEIRDNALTIGKKIMAMGYRGIFSLDCLLNAQGRVFVLEINPRITGITPLLTMLYREGRDIPFYLLHILELANADYTIEDDSVDSVAPEGSLMVLHSQATEKVRLISAPPSGLYSPQTLEFEKPALRFTGEGQLLLQQYVPASIVKPGGRMLTVYTNGRVLSDTDDLLPTAQEQVTQIIKKVEVQRV